MRKFLTTCLALATLTAHSADILTLKNGASFEGKLKKVNTCSVNFSFDGDTYTIPASDIESVLMEKMSRKMARRITALAADDNNCYTGTMDGANHGKGGGHFAAGFFFGIFGIIGVAVTKRQPFNSANPQIASKNKQLWNDPEYLACYNKKAKSAAVTNAALGTLGYLLLLVSLASA